MAGTTIEPIRANALDQRLLANAANMSPDELSRLIGGVMSPVQVAAHVKKLLAARDWLTEAELDNLITYKLQSALTRLESQFEDADNMRNQLGFLKEIGNRLDKRRQATQFDLNALYGNTGRLMAQLFDMVLAYMRGALRDDIDIDRWDELADEAMQHARTEIERREAIQA